MIIWPYSSLAFSSPMIVRVPPELWSYPRRHHCHKLQFSDIFVLSFPLSDHDMISSHFSTPFILISPLRIPFIPPRHPIHQPSDSHYLPLTPWPIIRVILLHKSLTLKYTFSMSLPPFLCHTWIAKQQAWLKSSPHTPFFPPSSWMWKERNIQSC